MCQSAFGASPPPVTAPRGGGTVLLRRGVLVASAGIAAGVFLALGGARLIRGILYEVSATDPFTYIAATAVVLVAVLAATYVPARRAGEANPARVLRGT
jgi:putative ABC transport system permease protein